MIGFHRFGTDNHCRYAGVAQYPLRHAAQKQTCQCTTAPAAHQNQVTLADFGQAQDGIGWRPLQDLNLDVDTSLLKFVNRQVYHLSSCGKVTGHDPMQPWFTQIGRHGLKGVDHDHLGVMAQGQFLGILERLLGAR